VWPGGAAKAPTIGELRHDNRSQHRELGFFGVHGIDAEGKLTVRRELKRRYFLAWEAILSK
jgi:hypothetical protein